MNRFVFATLFSSSSGNSVYIKNGSEEYLIDAGVSAKRIEKSLNDIGTSLRFIKAIFITHEHIDHIKGIGTISSKIGIPIYAPSPCAEEITRQFPISAPFVRGLDPSGDCVSIGATRFNSFHTPHDSVESCGYAVETEKCRVAVATDMGFVTTTTAAAITGCRAIVLESNYDVNMLKNGSYPYATKMRILGEHGHLSNDDCAAFAPYLAKHGTTVISLSHISENNNTPLTAFNASYNSLKANGVCVCTENDPGDFLLTVSPPDGVKYLINE